MKATTERRVRRWQEQRWVLDSIVQSVGMEWDQPRVAYTLLPCGPEAVGEMRSIGLRVRKFSDMHREFAAAGRRRQARAESYAQAGKLVSARENWFVAALLYSAARWPIFETNATALDYNARMIECYGRYMQHAPRPTRRVEIPFGDHVLPGVLHLPHAPAPGETFPCAIALDGMDASKEIMVSMYGDKFIERGFAVFAYDGPGQGECPLNGLFVTPTNHIEAAQAVHDWLLTQPEIDAGKMVVTGVSFGTFFGLQAAAGLGDRILGTGVAFVCHEAGLETLMNAAAPSFKMRFMYMSGYEDEAAFDAFIKGFDLDPILARIAAPLLVLAGGDDELSPLEFTDRLMERVSVPRKLVVYEGERHAIGGNNPSSALGENWLTMLADWCADRVAGAPAESERIFIDSVGRVHTAPY